MGFFVNTYVNGYGHGARTARMDYDTEREAIAAGREAHASMRELYPKGAGNYWEVGVGEDNPALSELRPIAGSEIGGKFRVY